ncbi:MAG: FxLYD domain-containing protein, partial [bacterium]|nr:FxLYD domain-containing protein [bacterium]
ELGPTTPIDLAPGEIVDVRLDATTQPFDTWVAHAEVGNQGTDQGTGGEGASECPEGTEGAGEGTETGAGGGEENTTQYGLNDTFDQVRAGSRLIMNYDPAANAFIGTVENTTNTTLTNVRIEIHLSNGVELGPTTPIDLAPGEIVDVRLDATTQPFDTWVAHAEVGNQGTDQGTGGEGAGEGSEGSGEGRGEGHGSEGGGS